MIFALFLLIEDDQLKCQLFTMLANSRGDDSAPPPLHATQLRGMEARSTNARVLPMIIAITASVTSADRSGR